MRCLVNDRDEELTLLEFHEVRGLIGKRLTFKVGGRAWLEHHPVRILRRAWFRNQYRVQNAAGEVFWGNSWELSDCQPCQKPASHDTQLSPCATGASL
jgi:hypothetical protein